MFNMTGKDAGDSDERGPENLKLAAPGANGLVPTAVDRGRGMAVSPLPGIVLALLFFSKLSRLL